MTNNRDDLCINEHKTKRWWTTQNITMWGKTMSGVWGKTKEFPLLLCQGLSFRISTLDACVFGNTHIRAFLLFFLPTLENVPKIMFHLFVTYNCYWCYLIFITEDIRVVPRLAMYIRAIHSIYICLMLHFLVPYFCEYCSLLFHLLSFSSLACCSSFSLWNMVNYIIRVSILF